LTTGRANLTWGYLDVRSAEFRAGIPVATRFQHRWLGVEHVLLGLLESRPDSVAGDILVAAGVDKERLVREYLVAVGHSNATDVRVQNAPSTSTSEFLALGTRADAFAAALGDGTVRSQDILVALLWTGGNGAVSLLERHGVGRDDILTIMRERGLSLPRANLPGAQRRPLCQRIEYPRDASHEVLIELQSRYPYGSGGRWGFNDDGADTAWIVAEEGLDVESVITEVLRREQ